MESRTWRNQLYEVSYGKFPPSPNWFSTDKFVEAIRQAEKA